MPKRTIKLFLKENADGNKAARIVRPIFEIARPRVSRLVLRPIVAANAARARNFYSASFDWKIQPLPGMKVRLPIDTGGGTRQRKRPSHGMANYINVNSVVESAIRLEKAEDGVCMAKTAVPQMDCFVMGTDTEANRFGLWETNPNAK